MAETHEKTAARYDRVDQRLGEAISEFRGLMPFDYAASTLVQELMNVRQTARAGAQRHRQLAQAEA